MRKIFGQVEINIPLLDAMAQMPVYAKYLKELITKQVKKRMKGKAKINEQVSALLYHKIPPKLADTGPFVIPCKIGNLEVTKALCDSRVSVSMMPLSLWKRMGEYKL